MLPKATFELLSNHVAGHFYIRTRERLHVEELKDDFSNVQKQDFVVASESVLKNMRSHNSKAVVTLGKYKSFLASCGGGSGPTSFSFDGAAVVGLVMAIGSSDVPELPEFLDFLHNKSERFVLVATSQRAIDNRDKFEFFYLTQIILSVGHFMPIVEKFQTQHKIQLGSKVGCQPKDDRVQVRMVKQAKPSKNAVFELSFTNTTDRPIRDLQAYFFNSTAKAFKNAHGFMRFRSRVNSTGPIAGYHFGSLLPGYTITRRIEYDLSFGNGLSIAWSPIQAVFQDNDGGGFGNGCTTTEPEPIPDPFPDGGSIALTSGCFDAGCSNAHCQPHACRDDEDGCGCYRL